MPLLLNKRPLLLLQGMPICWKYLDDLCLTSRACDCDINILANSEVY